jgi:glutathione S-transferase
MTVTLYALPGSHPCAAVEAALDLKGISYRRVDMLPLAQVIAGPLLYGGITVPGMRMDGERIVGSRTIMRRLDQVAPDPPLLPSDPSRRERVLDAERFGDEVLQSAVRRILDLGFVRAPKAMESYAADANLPIPPSAMRPLMPLTARLMALRNRAGEQAARSDLSALGSHFDRIEQWIDAGDLGGDQPNAADLQIGSSIRLLATIADLRPAIEAHPRIAALTRHFGSPQAGEIPAGTLPAQWLPEAA